MRQTIFIIILALVLSPLLLFTGDSVASLGAAPYWLVGNFGLGILGVYLSEYLGISFLTDLIEQSSHFDCYFGCQPVDVLGFFIFYIPWALLLLIIFGPLLYFTRKK